MQKPILAAEWDRRQEWANDGACNGRCWLAKECTLSRGEAFGILLTGFPENDAVYDDIAPASTR